MLVHIVADDRNKISELRSLFSSHDRITSVLLNDESSVPKECDAIIIAVDLRNAGSIAALEEVSATFNGAPRKIFVIDPESAAICGAGICARRDPRIVQAGVASSAAVSARSIERLRANQRWIVRM